MEVGGARKNGRAPVLSCSHYFQAPATQATQRKGKAILKIPLLRTPMGIWICMHMYVRELIFFICHKTKTTLLYLCCISVHMIVGLNAQSAGRYALILSSTFRFRYSCSLAETRYLQHHPFIKYLLWQAEAYLYLHGALSCIGRALMLFRALTSMAASRRPKKKNNQPTD